jgi:putative oxidoreductase
MILRRLARPLLASRFVLNGVDAVRNPAAHKGLADALSPLSAAVPQLAEQPPESIVRLHGGLQVGAGALLALNKVPRLSAFVLAATIVPTALADRAGGAGRSKLVEDASTLGALLLATADTAGQPGLGWRARHRAEHTAAATRRTRRQARVAAKIAKAEARAVAKAAKLAAKGAAAKIAA